MYHKDVAGSLSNAQRRHLVGMVDGPKPYIEVIEHGERWTRLTLFRKRLIRSCGPEGGLVNTNGAKFYCLTEDGRAVLCCVLGEYADAIVAAERVNFPGVRASLTGLVYRRGVEGGRPDEAVPKSPATVEA
jgi:hypothetical protein